MLKPLVNKQHVRPGGGSVDRFNLISKNIYDSYMWMNVHLYVPSVSGRSRGRASSTKGWRTHETLTPDTSRSIPVLSRHRGAWLRSSVPGEGLLVLPSGKAVPLPPSRPWAFGSLRLPGAVASLPPSTPGRAPPQLRGGRMCRNVASAHSSVTRSSAGRPRRQCPPGREEAAASFFGAGGL